MVALVAHGGTGKCPGEWGQDDRGRDLGRSVFWERLQAVEMEAFDSGRARRQDYRIGRRMSIRIEGDEGRTAPADAGEVSAGPVMDPGAVLVGGTDDATKSAWFEYIGKTALVLRGPYTGQRYWFERPGARLQVDPRDRHALLAVPVLRLVPG